MDRLEWFEELFERNPRPPHLARVVGHDYRILIVVEDRSGNDMGEMEADQKGVLRYAVVNDSHRRSVEATFISEAKRGAMIFSDLPTNNGAGPSRSGITAYAKYAVDEPAVPFEDLADIEVISGKRPQEVFVTNLTTEVETSRTKRKPEAHEPPLTNIVSIKRSEDPEQSMTTEIREPAAPRPDLRSLSGDQFRELTEALVSAFDTQTELEMMLRFRLDVNLATFVSPNDDLRVAAYKLIKKAQTEGWTYRLLVAATSSNPGNSKLLEISQQFGLSSIRPDFHMERWIREANPFLSAHQWRTKLAEIERQVCRIEVVSINGATYGTGFLIGPDVIMTNHHVIETVIASQKAETVALRFDYMEVEGETINPGVVYRLAPDWLIDFSPNNKAATVPSNDELDYALLRVAGSPGEEPIGDRAEPKASPRKWIRLPAAPYEFQPNSPLIIMQHPEATPLKLAMDTDSIISVNSNNTRVMYKTNTERGSSGAPCFDINLDLVALHHSGDPNFSFGHVPEYNEGIPLAAILARIEGKGLMSVLKQ